MPRILQQQPPRDSDPQQQQSGSNDFQPKADGPEGGSSRWARAATKPPATTSKNIKEYLKKADVEADAEAAKPRSEQEARDLEQAEKEGRSHSKGER